MPIQIIIEVKFSMFYNSLTIFYKSKRTPFIHPKQIYNSFPKLRNKFIKEYRFFVLFPTTLYNFEYFI